MSDVIYMSDFPGLVDIVEEEGESAFLVKQEKGLKIIRQFSNGKHTVKPPPVEDIPWMLPRGREVLAYYRKDTEEELYQDLLAYHKSVSEIEDDRWYHIFTLWDFHTHLIDRFNFSPYIWLHAPYERGKTRTGKGLIYVARRGVYTPCLREAFLIRFACSYGGSIFIDVVDLWKKAQQNGVEDILMLRCEKGAKLPRILNPKEKYQMTFYDVFGPTVIATNTGTEKHLDTRSIKIIMKESRKVFNSDITEEYARPYRERLVASRARLMNASIPEIPKILPGRVGDIFRPLQQVAELVKFKEKDMLRDLCLTVEEETKLDLSAEVEGAVVEAIAELSKSAAVSTHHNKTVSIMPLKELTKHLNSILGYRGMRELDRITVGKILKGLGIKKIRRNTGIMVVYDHDRISKLAEYYGIDTTKAVRPIYKCDE